MYSVARTTQYPLLCSSCDRNTATSADELLDKKQLQCRHCKKLMTLNENQLNTLRRTLADLASFMTVHEEAAISE